MLVAGLGNPGRQYEKTRHNIGFKVIDYLASHYKINLDSRHFNAEWGKLSLFDKNIFLIKPQTYMNRSGSTIKSFVEFYKIAPENILIIHDDIDLPFGDVRLKSKGGGAGHHGIESIMESLGTDHFKRIRCGIGRPLQLETEISDFVLSSFSSEEHQQLLTTFQKILNLFEKMLAPLK